MMGLLKTEQEVKAGLDVQISLCDDGDEGEGEQQRQDVLELLHRAPQPLYGRTNSPGELLIQHRLLLLLLQEATRDRSHSADSQQVSPEGGAKTTAVTLMRSSVLNSLDSRSTDRFS